MKNMTVVIWDSDGELAIPKFGMAKKGRRMILPAKTAQSFVDRKMAKYPPKKKETE